MIKLSPNIVLSNRYTNGNVKSRIQRSEKINSQIFQRIIPLFENKNSCYLSDIKLNYKKSMPENKAVDVVPIKQSVHFEQSGYVAFNDDVVSANYYILGIESRKKGKKENVSAKSLPDFMHESTHVLDYLLNPKYLANMVKMQQMGIFDKPYYEIYDNLFYNSEHVGVYGLKNKSKIIENAEKETRKALQDVPFKEKLVFLNYIKYSMETEYNAYNQECIFVDLLKKMRNFAFLKKHRNCNDYYHFPEKIELVNKLIKEAIDKERAK